VKTFSVNIWNGSKVTAGKYADGATENARPDIARLVSVFE